MNCIFPPEIDDEHLLLYLDDEADDQTIIHLRQCAYCRERATQLADALARLTAPLFRLNCPSSDQLGEYQLQLLPEADMVAIRHHLTECPHCTRELNQLNTFMQTLAADSQPRILEQARIAIARLISGGTRSEGTGAGPLMPAFGIRGDAGEPRLYDAGVFQITLDIQDDEDQPDLKRLFGLIIGLDEAGQVELWHDEALRATVEVDSLGNFIFAALALGTYDLRFRTSEHEIYIQDIEID